MVAKNDPKSTPDTADKGDGWRLSAEELAENEKIFGGKTVEKKDASEQGLDTFTRLTKIDRHYDDKALREDVDFDEYLRGIQHTVVNALDFVGTGEEYLLEDNYVRLPQKEPAIIREFELRTGDQGNGQYCVIHVLGKGNRKYVFSTGAQFSILEQLVDIAEQTGRTHDIYLPNGFFVQLCESTDESAGKTYNWTKVLIAR